MEEIVIRRYHPRDREQVRILCCETGFLGNPIDDIFEDRAWFADLNTNYYLQYEPRSCFVAEKNGSILGYVLCSRHPLRFALIFYLFIAFPLFTKALFKCLTRRYSAKSRKFIYRLITRGSLERPKRPRATAHLHLNVKEGFRGMGLGRRLVETLFDYLVKEGVRGIYGELTFVESRQSEQIYTKHGFLIYDKRPTSIWGKLERKTYLMCIKMDLRNWAKRKEK